VGRILLSIVLGLFAPLVAFMAAEMVEVPGQNPIQEPIAAGIAVAIYLAICQFLVTRREKRTLSANWPTMIALGAPLLASSFIAEAKDLWERAFMYGPIVISGWLGIVAGAIVAARVTLSAVSLDLCRRSLRACAALLGGAALVIAAGVIPLTKRAGTFPDGTPGQSLSVFWAIAVLTILGAASLASIAVRAGHGRRPSFVVLGLLAFLAFVPACGLAIPAFKFLGHGPVLRIASVLLFVCLAAELVVTALVGTTALRLPDERAA
jgi:hypothetical protein